MAAVGRDGNNPINNQRFYAEDSFSDVDDRFKGNLTFNLIWLP
jgi:hypothetical protein